MLIQEAANSLDLSRPLLFFASGKELIRFLEESDDSPFLILSDVNLPGETGFDIKKQISEHAELRYKSVPFIFWSTTASEPQIREAYDLPAQGFFFKSTAFDELCETFRMILAYWQKSQHPKRVV